MAVVACIGCTCFCCKVRTGDPEAVVTTVVITHIVFTGHMAVDALGAGAFDIFWFTAVDERAGHSRIHLMKMMLRGVINIWSVALEAKPVVRLNGLCRV